MFAAIVSFFSSINLSAQAEPFHPQAEALNPQAEPFNPAEPSNLQAESFNPQAESFNPEAEEFNPQAEPLNHEAVEGISDPLSIDDCVACTETKPISELYHAPCSHRYCTACTTKMFEDSLKDETLYPPRCCQQDLALEFVSEALGPEFVTRFITKAIEVASTDRTYCHACSAFILPCDIEDDIATCESCSAPTCAQCKEAAHGGNCVLTSDRALDELAEAQNWRSCPRCHAVVELREGCNHIT